MNRVEASPVPTPDPLIDTQPVERISLVQRFGDRRSPLKEKIAMRIIDGLNFNQNESDALFFCHLWHETGSLGPFKRYMEIREDPTIEAYRDKVVNKVLDDDELVRKYNTFYEKYKNAVGKPNKQRLGYLLKRGYTLEETANEFEITVGEALEILIVANKKLAQENQQQNDLVVRAEVVAHFLNLDPSVKQVMIAKILSKESSNVSVELSEETEEIFSKFSLLMRTNHIGVAIGKQSGSSHKDIATNLGITKPQVDRISARLIAKEVIDPHPKGKDQFHQARKRLSGIVHLRGLLSSFQIAHQTGESPAYVAAAFKRKVNAGALDRLDKRRVIERNPQYHTYFKIREGVQRLRLVKDHKYTEQEIADILTEELGQEVTRQQVKRQIRILLRDEKIERRIN